ncbi:hypothetical protein [Paenibacillus sp. FSL R7-0331]|uniref:hypothetical protein n=1 Tax=Paenibacillus sp. FSL R7-0331 TaxID=1536773 RepID=UPI0004F7803D|nr:hypothetical protein [Paenibacillus sp. FSL R7-0331]AIQ50337.1 hypothetical protein R70331_01460 [Paenibacillus sp. FSL R7-0331]
MNKRVQIFLAVLVLIMPLFASAGRASAAAVVLTPSIQAAFDLTAAAASTQDRARLKSQYSELDGLAAQYDSREEQIRVLHESNAQSLITVRKQITEIDQAAVAKLAAAVTSTKERYQPLFDQYSALNSRIALVKGLKDKTLNAILKTQADAMKITVQFARQDIRDKEAVLKAAKEARTRKIAAARKTLSGIESPQTSIKTQKSAASALNKRITADFSSFKTAIRKQNPALAGQSLTSLVSGYKQIAASKQKIIELEQKVAAVIAATLKQTGS